MDIRRKARPKPWIAKSRGRNVRRKDTGELIKPFEGVDSSFYKTSEWKATRDAVVARDGVCAYCLGMARVTPATECDHIIPLNQCEDKGIHPHDQTNLTGCCRSCNSRKAAWVSHGIRLNTLDQWIEYFRRKTYKSYKS
jgi:5-methylcytosine-specific restriction endonuclease McrA